jgi:enamine deaminase RidA (YjgF/YER057c/UK114 family)
LSTPEQRLEDLGIDLPHPAAPLAAYVPAVRTGDLVFVSGQLPLVEGKPVAVGRLGGDVGLEEGQAAAQRCAINVIAVLKLTGFVACEPDFTEQAKVVNGASELFGEVFGDRGQHARAAVGMAALPFGVPVEVEAIVEVE